MGGRNRKGRVRKRYGGGTRDKEKEKGMGEILGRVEREKGEQWRGKWMENEVDDKIKI